MPQIIIRKQTATRFATEILGDTTIYKFKNIWAENLKIFWEKLDGSIISEDFNQVAFYDLAAVSPTAFTTIEGLLLILETGAYINFKLGEAAPGTLDEVPTSGSTNGVQSGGVFNQFAFKQPLTIVESIVTTGAVVLDFNNNTFNKITQTGSLVFSGINILGTKNIEKTFIIDGSGNVAHTATFPTTWQNLSGVAFDSTKRNFIQLNNVNGTVVFSLNKFDIPDTTAPTLLKATILLEALTVISLTYSENLDAAITPSTSWYTVAGKTVTAVTILGNKVRVTVNTAFTESDNPSVTFTNASSNGIQDASGNLAANFTQNIGLLTYRTDNFNRTDSAVSVNSPSDGGSDWTVPFGAAWGIVSNKAYNAGANTVTAQANVMFLEASQSDVIVRAKYTYGATGNASTSFIMRYVDANNHYIVQFGRVFPSQLIYAVYKIVGGVATTVIAQANFGSAWVNGTEYTFMAKFSGNTLTLYNGTTQLAQITDSSIVGTKHGFRTYSGSGSTGNTDRLDDFGVYSD